MSRWCSREGSLAGCRRTVLAVCVLGFVLTVLLAMEAPGDEEAIAESRAATGEDEPSHANGDVRCPDCDEKGRMKCLQCEGKGLLARDCPACGATGRRPCKVCTEGQSADSPGRLICPGCAGAGTVGDEGRACPRCGGAQTVICSACLGKGSFSCRRQIFDKVCPACRFSGTVECTTCEGRLWLSPAVLASRKAKAPSSKASATENGSEAEAASARAGSSKKPRRRSNREDDEEEAEVREEADPDALRTRFSMVTPTYERHYDVFVDDLRFEISAIGDKVKDLERKLRGERVAQPLQAELVAWQRRARDFYKRWGELRELFSKERQAHLGARRVWEAYDEGIKGLKGYRRELFEKQYASRLGITTEIAETASERLARLEPETLVEESRQLTALWKEYEKSGETELALAAKKAAEEAERAEEARKAAEAKKEEERRRVARAAARERAMQQSGQAPDDAGPSRAERARAESADGSEPEEARREGKASRGARETVAEQPPESGGIFGTVLAVLIGFAAASCLFVLKGSRHRRSGE